MRSMASTSSLGPCRPADSSAMRRSQRSRSTASCTAGLRSTWPPSARSWRGRVRASCFSPAVSSPSWPRASAPRIRPFTPESRAWPARPPGRAWARWRVWRSTASAKRSLRPRSPPASSSAGWASQAERRRPMTSGRQARASQRWFSASQRSRKASATGAAGAPSAIRSASQSKLLKATRHSSPAPMGRPSGTGSRIVCWARWKLPGGDLAAAGGIGGPGIGGNRPSGWARAGPAGGGHRGRRRRSAA